MKKFIIVLLILLIIPANAFAKINVKETPKKGVKNNESANSKRENSDNSPKENANTKEELKKIKKMLNISNEFKDFNITSQQIPESPNQSGYEFLNKRAKGKLVKSYTWENDEKIINASVLNGRIIYYNFYDKNEEDEKTALKKYNKSECIKKVQEFLKNIEIDPDNYRIVELNLLQSKNLSIKFIRYIDNVPFFYDIFQVDFDISKDMVTTFSRYEYEKKFAFFNDADINKEEKLDEKKAREVFAKKQGLQLMYLSTDKEAKLVYALKDPLCVDAINGNLVDNLLDLEIYKNKEAEAKGLSEVENTELKKIKGLKSKEDAKKIASKLAPKGCNISYINTDFSKSDDAYIYEIGLVKEKDIVGSISLDAKTLKLKSLYFYDIKNDAKLKEDELKKIALSFVKKYANTDELNFDKAQIIKNKKINEKNFVKIPRYVNNIEVYDEGITLNVASSNKTVMYFSENKSKNKFLDKKPKIDQNKAHEIYFSSDEFLKQYIATDSDVHKVYGVNELNPIIIDANTLEFLSPDGEVLRLNKKYTYEDIDKSKYKDEIEVLSDMNIGLYDKKLKDEIDHIEAMDLISRSADYMHNLDSVLKDILGVKDTKDLKGKVINQADFVKYTCKIFHEDILKQMDFKVIKENLFKIKDEDFKEGYLKYYQLLKALNEFNQEPSPDEKMNLEEALHMIYEIRNVENF